MKKILCILLLYIGFSHAENVFRLEVKDEQPNNDRLLGLRLRLVSEDNFQNEVIAAKLYIHNPLHKKYKVAEYYMKGSTVSVENGVDDYVVLRVVFSNVHQGYNPEENGISFGLYDSDWRVLDKGEIFSNTNSAVFSEVMPYELFIDGLLVASTFKQPAPKLRFVGVRPETANSNSPWVQIQNYGSSKIYLDNISIVDNTGKQYHLRNFVIEPKKTLRICSGEGLNCAADSSVEIIFGLAFGKVGEFVLRNESNPIDRIAWGEKRKFFDTSEDPVAGPVSIYRKGDFFRAVILEETDSIIAWNKYREEMVNESFSMYPYAEPFSLLSGTEVFKHSNEETVFAWKPVNGAKAYELIIVKANDKSLVYRNLTKTTSQSVLLGDGEYLWLVKPYGGNAEGEPYYGYTPWDPTYNGEAFPFKFFNLISINVLDGTETFVSSINVEPLAARKDSYMLDVKWGEHIIESDWDKPHNISGYVDGSGNRRFTDLKHKHYDTEESWRCWAVAAAMINHFYGGNLTQDEIKYYGKGCANDCILNALPHDEEGGGNVYSVLPWTLNIFASQLHYSAGAPSDEIMLEALKNNTPIVVWENSHIMVVDAALYSRKKKKYVFRYKNVDNDGTVEWRRPKFDGSNLSYCLPEDPRKNGSNVRMSELFRDINSNGVMDREELFDEDQDGVADFDEINRFHTLAKDSDSDHDGISDKIEIMSYTIREVFPIGVLGVKNEIYADIDKDGKRAEIDPDSDNDGRYDGQEDVNHNGIKDRGETDVFLKDSEINERPFDYRDITLYALSQLYYNDGVVCYNERMKTGLCTVASASELSDGEQNAILIGARADVGDIVSRGNVLLRSGVHVHGNVHLAGNFMINDIYKQNGTIIDGQINQYTYEAWHTRFYPQNYNQTDYFIPSHVKGITVCNGESYILQSGVYSYIKVEAGGLLYIPASIIYTGSIQFDSRSKIIFTSPGKGTLFYVNGNFTWRATILNDETQYPYIAQGVKLVLHTREDERVFMDNFVAGTVVAPSSSVVVAQSNKLFYGTIFAKNITVHQYAQIYHIDFSPIRASVVANKGRV